MGYLAMTIDAIEYILKCFCTLIYQSVLIGTTLVISIFGLFLASTRSIGRINIPGAFCESDLFTGDEEDEHDDFDQTSYQTDDDYEDDGEEEEGDEYEEHRSDSNDTLQPLSPTIHQAPISLLQLAPVTVLAETKPVRSGFTVSGPSTVAQGLASASLMAENARMIAQLESMRELYYSVMIQNNDYETELLELKKRSDAVTDNALASAVVKMTTLENELVVARRQEALITKDFDTCQKELLMMRTELAVAHAALSSANEAHSTRKSSLETAESNVAFWGNLYNEKKVRVDELIRERDHWGNEYNKRNKEAEELKAECVRLQGERDYWGNQYNIKNTEVESSKAENRADGGRFRSECDHWRKETEKALAHIKMLEEQIRRGGTWGGGIEEANAEIHALKLKLRGKANAPNEELNSYIIRLASADAEIKRLTAAAHPRRYELMKNALEAKDTEKRLAEQRFAREQSQRIDSMAKLQKAEDRLADFDKAGKLTREDMNRALAKQNDRHQAEKTYLEEQLKGKSDHIAALKMLTRPLEGANQVTKRSGLDEDEQGEGNGKAPSKRKRQGDRMGV